MNVKIIICLILLALGLPQLCGLMALPAEVKVSYTCSCLYVACEQAHLFGVSHASILAAPSL